MPFALYTDMRRWFIHMFIHFFSLWMIGWFLSVSTIGKSWHAWKYLLFIRHYRKCTHSTVTQRTQQYGKTQRLAGVTSMHYIKTGTLRHFSLPLGSFGESLWIPMMLSSLSSPSCLRVQDNLYVKEGFRCKKNPDHKLNIVVPTRSRIKQPIWPALQQWL